MRLIDAEQTKREITKYLEECIDNNKIEIDVTELQIRIFGIINNQPTAYDTEKVVAELEKYKVSHLVEHDSERYEHCKEEEINCDGRDCFLCVWDKAILIVRKGGV